MASLPSARPPSFAENVHSDPRSFNPAQAPQSEVLQALPVPVYTTAADGMVTFFNEAVPALAGRRPQLGMDRWCISHRLFRPDGTFLPHDQCPMAITLKTGIPQRGLEIIAERPDGSRTWLAPFPSLLRDSAGTITGGMNVLFDITQRKQSEDLFHDIQQRLSSELADAQQLQRISTEIGYGKNPAQLYEDILDAAVSIAHSDFASIQRLHPEHGMHGELHLLGHRGFSARAAREWEWIEFDAKTSCALALRTGKRVVIDDIEQCDWAAGVLDLDSYRQAGLRSMQSTPLIARDGTLLGMLSTHWRVPSKPSEHHFRMIDILARLAADLMERCRTEERQRQAENELRKSEKFAAAGRMASTIAHEINNPLESIVNLTFLLAMEDLSANSRAYLDCLVGELDRVCHITRKTLEFYRQGRAECPVDLATTIYDAVGLFSRRAEAQGTHIEVNSRTPATVFALAGELRQVFSNLLNNSLEAGATYIKIRISPAAENGAPDRRGVRVLIADNGSGILEGHSNRIFDPFFTTKYEKGKGLGLWVTKSIVQKHEGRISVRSRTEPDRSGTCFSVFLPTS